LLRNIKLRLYLIIFSLFVVSGIAAYISEAVGINENLRKILHLLFLAIVFSLGYLYWKKIEPKWMIKLWMFSYVTNAIVFFSVSILHKSLPIFSEIFMDQIRYVRLFFTSPIPFFISLIIAKIYDVQHHHHDHHR